MNLDLEAIKEYCRALGDRMGKKAWTLEGPNQYGLFSVYDGDGNVVSNGIEEQQDFIAHSRADVPALVAEAERLQDELEQTRREVNGDIGYLELACEAEVEADRLRAKVKWLRASLEAILDEATSDLNRDIIITECQSALAEAGREI